MVSTYINYLRQLKEAERFSRLAIEITAIIVIKAILLMLLWAMFFAHPVTKDTRQAAITRHILNQSK